MFAQPILFQLVLPCFDLGCRNGPIFGDWTEEWRTNPATDMICTCGGVLARLTAACASDLEVSGRSDGDGVVEAVRRALCLNGSLEKGGIGLLACCIVMRCQVGFVDPVVKGRVRVTNLCIDKLSYVLGHAFCVYTQQFHGLVLS